MPIQQTAPVLAFSVPAAGNTEVVRVPCDGMARLFVQFDVATNNLDAFRILARSHDRATAAVLYSLAADFTVPTGLLVGTSGDLTTVAAGSSGWFIMDVRGLLEVRIEMSAASGAATVNLYAGAQ